MKRYNGGHLIFAKFWLVVVLFGLEAPRLAAQTPVNFKVAFIGDQGSGSNATAVLNLIKNEGAHAVVHSGDFDYNDNPAAWDGLITSVLGANFPYFASVGNHDDGNFYGSGGYQSYLAARMNRLGITWDGDLGTKSSFKYQGIFFVLTGPDVIGSGHDVYIRDKLAADNSIWSISSWHKNMRLMQVGGKGDEAGWPVYEESRKGGAIIATAHEHSYSRTHLLSSCQNQTVASTSNTLVLTEDLSSTPQDEGKTFVFVSGLGGKSVRSQSLSGAWWASIYTSSQGATYGALFGVFNFNGEANKAHFYFKAINGAVPDDFYVISNVTPPDATPPSAPAGLAATANGEKIDLAWTAASDAESGINGYKIYRGTTAGGETFLAQIGNVTSYTDQTTLPNTAYFYQVSAVNGGGLESSRSNEANATTGDNAPAAPTSLSASAGNQQVSLNWNDNSESDLAGYHVYRSTTPGGPYTKITTSLVTASAYTDAGLTNGTRYYYVVIAQDVGGNESTNSNEANAIPIDIDPTLVGYWKFDEGSGTTAADASGNGNHGTLQNGPTWTTGQIGGALRFDGTNDLVLVPDAASLKPTSTLSVFLWINKEASDTAIRAAITKENASNRGWLIYHESTDKLTCGLDTDNNQRYDADELLTSTNTVSRGSWHHVGFTFNLGVLTVYVDGLANGSKTLTETNIPSDPDALRIGIRGDGKTQPWAGLLDEVRIYNRVLSAAEIAALAQRDATPPSAPAGLTATASGEQVNLSWTAASDAESGISGYKIYRGATAGGETFLAQVGNVMSYTDGATSPNTTYFYQVSALNGAGLESVKSSEASAVTGNNPPAAPAGLSASAGNQQISLNWNDNSESDLAGYHLYRSTTAGGPYTRITTSLVTVSAYTDAGLTNGTTYYYVVTAQDVGGSESTNSNEVNVTPGDNPPSAPTGLTASAGNQQVTLDWNDNSEADLAGYHVYRATTSGGPHTRITASLLTSSSYTDAGLNNGTRYYYVVTAKDVGDNESANSNEANAIPTDSDPTLVGYWKFDEGSGTVAADASGNGNHGTLQNGPTWTTGQIGGALSFDGTNDLVLVPDAASLKPANTLSVFLWINKESSDTAIRTAIAKENASNRGWLMYHESTDKLTCGIDTDNNQRYDADELLTSTNTVSRGLWHHVGFTFNRGVLTVYVDGVANGAKTLSETNIPSDPDALRIGVRGNGGTQPWAGLLDEVRIYNRVLSAAEIAALAQSDATPPSAPAGLTATASGEQINLSWTAASDAESGISGYKIYRGITTGGETFLAQVGNVTNYTDGVTSPNTTYFYQVSALNGAGMEGPRSNEASTVTGNDPPAAPTGLTTTAGNQQVTLNWNDNSESDLAGYHVYRATTSGGPYTRLTTNLLASSLYTDTGLSNGIKYYYVVTAEDVGGNASANSNEANATPTDIDPTLVGYWQFDEGNGTVAADASGNGNNGTLQNGPTWTTGQIGSALRFDGTNDLVLVPDAASLKPTSTLSVFLWINKEASDTAIRAAIAKENVSNRGWLIYHESTDKLTCGIDTDNSQRYDADELLTSTNTVSRGAWHHVGFTFNRGVLTVYVDGVSNGSRTLTETSIPLDPDALRIGIRGDGRTQPWFGLLDEVRIYNRVLSAAEIQALTSGAVPKHSTPESDVDLREDFRPQNFHLEQNYPNPFPPPGRGTFGNPTTVIRYNLPAPVHVKLIISDLLGHKVRTLVDVDEPAGYRHVTWDGTNDAGVRVGSGLYLMRFEAGDYRMNRKLMLMK